MNFKSKKLAALLAAAAVALSLLTACGVAPASSAAASSAASAASSGQTASSAASSASSAAAISVTLTVTDKDGNKTDVALAANEGETLGDALIAAEVVSADEAATGMVSTVNGITADYNADGAWWMLVDANGDMTAVGINDITLHEGDSYGFIYTVG